MEPNLAAAGLRAIARAATVFLLLVIPGSTASTIMSAQARHSVGMTPPPRPSSVRLQRADVARRACINPIIGDTSFLLCFGRMPTAADDERLRIGTHLAYVETVLRARDVSALTPALRAARAHNLDLLHEYRRRGAFPLNERYRERRPCFIDGHGTICAVGYLVEQTAGRPAAETVNRSFQYAAIGEMASPTLDAWLATSGLTREEIGMIQPTYGPSGVFSFVEMQLTYADVERERLGLSGAVRSLTTRSGDRVERSEFNRSGLLTAYELGSASPGAEPGDARPHPSIRMEDAVVLYYVTPDSALAVESRRYTSNPHPRTSDVWNACNLEEIEYAHIRHGVYRADSLLRYESEPHGRIGGEVLLVAGHDTRRSVRYLYDTITGGLPILDRFELRTPFPAPLDDGPRGIGAVGGTDTCPVRYGLAGADTVLLELCDGAGRPILMLQRIGRDGAAATAETFNRRGDPIRRQCMVGRSLPELLAGNGTIVWTQALTYWYDQDGNWTKRVRTTTVPAGGAIPEGTTELTTRELQYWREPAAPR